MNYFFDKLTPSNGFGRIKTSLQTHSLCTVCALLLLLIGFSVRVNAQTAPASITVAGACLTGTYVLDKVADNYEGTGRPAYLGSGTATIGGTTYADIGIAVFYEPSGPAWVMAFDGQPYQSNPATSTLPPTYGWVVENSGGIGSCSGSAPLFVTSGSVKITAPAVTTVCASSPVSLTATATNFASSITYTWRSSPTGFSASGTSATFTQNAPSVNAITTYTITVTATSGTSSATASVGITVKPTPTLVVGTGTGPTTCGGTNGSIAFTSTNLPNGTYSLTYTGAGSPRNVTVTNNAFGLTGLSAGTYSNFSITSNGCAGAVATARTLSDPAAPTLTVGAATNTTTCGGINGSIAFTSTNLSNGTYVLTYTGAGSPQTVTVSSNAFSLTGLAAGTYSNFSITANGCVGSVATARTISDPAAPVATLSSSGPLSCTATTVTLTAGGAGVGGTYLFSSGATQVGGGNTATVSTAGVYSVTVISANGCTGTTSATVTGSTTPTPVSLTASSPLSCSVTSATLTATSGFASYSFSAGATQQGGVGSNLAAVTTAGTYSVTAVNASACRSTATVTVTQGPDLTPILYARPSTANGVTNITVVVDIVEVNTVATNGLITVKLTRDAKLTLSLPTSATSVNGRSVQNSIWTLNSSDPNFYVVSTSQPIAAGDKLSFGLTGVLTPGATTGMFALSAIIAAGGVCEMKQTNNADADKIEYFQQ